MLDHLFCASTRRAAWATQRIACAFPNTLVESFTKSRGEPFDLSGSLHVGLFRPFWAAFGIGWTLHKIGLIGVERGGQILFSGTPFIGALGGILVGSVLIWRFRMPLS